MCVMRQMMLETQILFVDEGHMSSHLWVCVWWSGAYDGRSGLLKGLVAWLCTPAVTALIPHSLYPSWTLSFLYCGLFVLISLHLSILAFIPLSFYSTVLHVPSTHSNEDAWKTTLKKMRSSFPHNAILNIWHWTSHHHATFAILSHHFCSPFVAGEHSAKPRRSRRKACSQKMVWVGVSKWSFIFSE